MSKLIPWRDAYEILIDSATFIVSGSGASVHPVFGDYLDAIAGEVQVFMTIQDGMTLRAFPTNVNVNDPVPVDDNGYMKFVDSNGQWMSILATPLPPPGPDMKYASDADASEP